MAHTGTYFLNYSLADEKRSSTMPIYEFYCRKCNTIFSFLSKAVDTEKIPSCPRDSSHALSRRVSMFAALSAKAKADESGEGGLDDLPIDESRMERAVEALAGEAENLNEEDPRQAARLMRKFSDMTGLQFKGKFEEALSRMESGEDPEALEAEMGDALGGEDEMPFELPGQKGGGRKGMPRPLKDETLYDM
jgi:putative FmdB family regulatory protein